MILKLVGCTAGVQAEQYHETPQPVSYSLHHGLSSTSQPGFFEKYRKMMIKGKEEYDKRKEEDSDLISNEKDNKKKSL